MYYNTSCIRASVDAISSKSVLEALVIAPTWIRDLLIVGLIHRTKSLFQRSIQCWSTKTRSLQKLTTSLYRSLAVGRLSRTEKVRW